MNKLLISASLLLTFIGCATYLPVAKTDEPASATKGFIFGHFETKQENLYVNTGIDLLDKSSNKVISIPFALTNEEADKVFVVPPGEYEIVGWFQIQSAGEKGPGKPLTIKNYNKTIKLNGGQAIYLGDFFALAKLSKLDDGSYLQELKITDVKNTKEETLKRLSVKYPFLNNLTAVSLFE